MNMNKIIKLATEIRDLRDTADKLEEQLRVEMVKSQQTIPIDRTKEAEKHADKFSQWPSSIFINQQPQNLTGLFNKGLGSYPQPDSMR